MRPDSYSFPLTRRRFAFWLGFGLFSIGEKLQAGGFDEVAAAAMRGAGKGTAGAAPAAPEHWRAAENRTWRWFERENLIQGQWTLTGVTTPIHKQTGELYTGRSGYLDLSLVPAQLRMGEADREVNQAFTDDSDSEWEAGEPLPHPARRARHGRPPSKWLRSLYADEIRIWLRSIHVPEADVSGMTFWTHLTRDHSFVATHIEGLSIDEQAKVHAAAHFGY